MSKNLLELTVELLTAHTVSAALPTEKLVAALKIIFSTLKELHKNDPSRNVSSIEGAEQAGTLAYLRQHPLESLQRDQVICLESGKPFKLLSNRHLALYGLTPREYKKKWGIPQTTPLSSSVLTQRRRKLAKEMGMGSQLAEWRAEKKRNNGVVIAN
jgi:predicted transcriptional regulator